MLFLESQKQQLTYIGRSRTQGVHTVYFEGWYIACDVNKRRTKIKRNEVEKK